MERKEKLLLIYLVSFFALYVSVIIYINYSIGNPIIPTEGTIKDSFIRLVNVNKKDIFLTIADIKDYPKILPSNYVSVNIINNTNNTIYAEEEVQEFGIKTKMLVKHTLIPYDKHVLTVLDGDANGTTITEIFEENGPHTKLTTNIDVHVRGILTPFAYLTKSTIDSAVSTVISEFVEYAKNEHAK